MAENLMEFVKPGEPYLHSKPRNFRWQVHNLIKDTALSGNEAADDLNETIEELRAISKQLKTEAERFLTPWDGDYKKASQELLGTTQHESKNPYATRLKAILNSEQFLTIVRQQYNYIINEEELQTILGEHGIKLTKTQLEKNSSVEERLTDYSKNVVRKIVNANKNSKRTGKRVYLEGFEKLTEFILGEVKQDYFKNSSSLEKRVLQGLQRRYKIVNWNSVYDELNIIFLSFFPNDKNAIAFMEKFKPLFFSQTKKLRAVEKSNISGFIQENLQASNINAQELQVTVHDLGDLTEDQIIEFAATLDSTASQISKMTHRGNSATQSGSDWIMVNSNGMMVRAQVKNSLTLAEEFEKEGKINAPQTIKVSDGIKYLTLQQNLKDYNKGHGISNDDWAALDYLVANILWIRAGKDVTKDKGADYKSGVSGIQELIDKLLTKEIGYFLGVTLDFNNQTKAVNAVIGGSNIFFVIDGLVLYPTYKLVDNIILQLRSVEKTLAKMHVTLGNDYDAKISVGGLVDKKQNIMKKNPWKKGEPYGEEMLATGREYGKNIIASLTISRVNLNININEILQTVYSTVLE